jgi:uncharacterized membrane protein
MDVLQSLFRWFHIVAGIIWIGHLYFFNFVNGPYQGTIDAETKKKSNPELLPRALFWFRHGALWTWVTGVLLLMIIFYHGQMMFDGVQPWTAGAFAMVAVTFLAFLVYDVLAKQEFAKDLKVLTPIGFVLIAIVVLLDIYVGGFGYRAYVIHTGAMFGTIMAFNVWFRIWPAQQKIITAVKSGTPPDAALVAMAGARSKHNTYLSVPLVWMMINSHTVVPFAFSFVYLLIMIAAGWWLTSMFYRQAAKVKGF